ncbi:MAG: hypothetical protein CEN91_405 [Candidatus Berkelbacteria bacterium Licking1014_85]|uniref:Transcriptional regulatory protein n=1 Tax=Candidatus Berkelbacteria bacterium Licking1014_85 TaxID=2017148 RepID=A0A554LI91_9BACT|nr:MAG: hypothetical protein CEN91_405 [Candidatus Berkelbacteria bacterium Licking1014_85]
MSGHSKWSTIKHTKALTDAKKSHVFSKLANAISLAARNGADPSMNPNLRLAIDKAKAAEMPSDIIQRAIQRGAGGAEGANLTEITYEAYGPAGVGIIIEAITDNTNRTLSEIRFILNKFGGKLTQTGSVSFNFEKKAGEMIPKYKISISDESKKEQIVKLLETLENLDDINNVWSNLR